MKETCGVYRERSGACEEPGQAGSWNGDTDKRMKRKHGQTNSTDIWAVPRHADVGKSNLKAHPLLALVHPGDAVTLGKYAFHIAEESLFFNFQKHKIQMKTALKYNIQTQCSYYYKHFTVCARVNTN